MASGERKLTLYSYGKKVGNLTVRDKKKEFRERVDARFEYHRKKLSEELGFDIEELRRSMEGFHRS